MHNCVYTKDKIKKKKKWIDGFIEKKGINIVLFTEDKEVISRSSYKILEDSTIEASIYLIVPENFEEFFNATLDENKSVEHREECNENITAIPHKRQKTNEDDKENKFTERIQGRSNQDVLNLFGKR